jgi:hypothetical protein
MIGVMDLGKVLNVRSFSEFFPPDSRAMSGVLYLVEGRRKAA